MRPALVDDADALARMQRAERLAVLLLDALDQGDDSEHYQIALDLRWLVADAIVALRGAAPERI